ncbi:MAG: aromatic amino acid lyase [candidate division WOR-3 bacterium]
MIEIDKKGLDLEKYKKIVYLKEKIKISKEIEEKINKNREKLLLLLKKGKLIYSVNTGVGKFADSVIPEDKRLIFQENILRSHAIGWGEPAPPEVVRGAILLRINSLSQGLSGVSLELIEKMVEFLNKDVIPFVPLKGSVGASGDLAPLSFIGLCIIGEGYILENKEMMPAYFILKKKNIEPYKLKEKEGIALINGTQFSLSLLIHSFFEFENLFKLAIISSLFSFVALDGDTLPLTPFLGKIRNSREQIYISKVFKKALKGYKKIGLRKSVQDPYTLRCIPQIFGTILEFKNFIEKLIVSEMNAVSDNPIIKDGKIIFGGNFHGQRLSVSADVMAILISILGNFSERRIFQLMGVEDILPKFLAKEEGFSSGYMIAHVISSALTSFNKTLSFPNSADTLPTSLNQEDFVSMSANSALRLFEMLENLKGVLLVEFISSLRAIYMRKIKLPEFLSKIYDFILEDFKIILEDHFLYEDIRKINEKVPILINKFDEVF